MSWANKRVQEYQKGANSTFIERRNLEHANPILFTLLILGSIVGVYGTWTHDWLLISIAAAMATVGHVYVWLVK